MKYSPPLGKAVLIRRYKQFLADVELASGEVRTIHCPNTGSMKHCTAPGSEIWFSTSDNPSRKYPDTWELIKSGGDYIGINTHRANKLVVAAIENEVIEELSDYQRLRTEVKYGLENSRIDILLGADDRPDCYVEVKSVTLLDTAFGDGEGFFPDAVSSRGLKHLRELAGMVNLGKRAVLVFCVQHTGIKRVSAARNIDPAYADALVEAGAAGVEILAYQCKMSPVASVIDRKLPVVVG
ncbi:MAG: DNA/RNA nuclease SfsA [Pseudomonadales bacterium]|nr:DNA/RNA nuclease SfsA [Pseudomonadales bacterium]